MKYLKKKYSKYVPSLLMWIVVYTYCLITILLENSTEKQRTHDVYEKN